jgi:hypothetical protein
MSAEEFWKDDPQLFVSYRTSFINKKKRELEETDYKCWLNGLYTHDGNGKLFSSLKQFISNMLSKTKDRNKIDTYPNKPYTELEKDKNREQINKKKKTNYVEFQNSLSYFGTMKQRYLDSLKTKTMKGE